MQQIHCFSRHSIVSVNLIDKMAIGSILNSLGRKSRNLLYAGGYSDRLEGTRA